MAGARQSEGTVTLPDDASFFQWAAENWPAPLSKSLSSIRGGALPILRRPFRIRVIARSCEQGADRSAVGGFLRARTPGRSLPSEALAIVTAPPYLSSSILLFKLGQPLPGTPRPIARRSLSAKRCSRRCASALVIKAGGHLP